jgi:signal transduction histidine kinase/ligand-binding sensor domain-containing protein/DNA-binding response OmpR family regulator
MRNIFCVILFSFFAVYQIHTNAQVRLDFDVLSIDDGFTSSRANAIIQDRKGFIWVGTWNGLNRFDGYECVVYQPGYRDEATLSNREVTVLLEDREGFIWIGTTFGLNKLNPVTNKLTVYPFAYRILSLFEDREGRIWVGTLDDGLYWLDKQTGKTHHCLQNETIFSIFEDSRHSFWVATSNGLLDFDRETNNYVRILNKRSDSYAETISMFTSGIVETKDGALWVGTQNLGLAKVVVNQDKNHHKIQFFDFTNAHSSSVQFSIERLCIDDESNIWIGTNGYGLCLLPFSESKKEPEKALFQSLKSDVNDLFSFSGNNYISALYVDRGKNLWVGSSLLNVANIGNNGLMRYNTREIDNNNVVNFWVRTLTGDNLGMLWLGTSDGIKRIDLNQPHSKMQKIISAVSTKVNNKTLKSNAFLSFNPNFNGNFLVGTDGAGILVYAKNEMYKASPAVAAFLNTETHPNMPGNRVNILAESRQNPQSIWIGTINNGIGKCTFLKGSFSFEHFKAGAGKGDLTNNNIRAIHEDKDGFVWIGTQHGLNRYDPKAGTTQHFYYSKSDTTSINDNVINVIYEDSNGDLWIGSNAGLNKKVERNGKVGFKPYPKFDRIDSDIILNILEDNHKNLWIGIYNGIVKFDLNEEKVVHEYFDKSYQRVKIDHNSCWKSAQGVFYFGGGTGFLEFHPDKFLLEETPVTVQITDLMIFNKTVMPNKETNGKTVLSNSISYTDSLELSYKDEVFTFVFSSMDFRAPDKTKYAYRLKGFDKDWNYVGSRNTATYTKIPPGKYVFEVKASNSRGEWDTQVTSVHVQVAPPWWRTLFAYVAYMVIIIVLLDVLIRIALIRVKERNRMELQRVQLEKEHELNELKVHFFTNITHEFRTPLTLILGPLEEMLERKSTFGPYGRNLELIQRNSQRLLRLINQLMEFRKVEKGKIELLLQEADVIPILHEIYDSFSAMAESKNIDFSLKYTVTELKAWIDRDKFDKVMFNLLSNAFKFTEDGGHIQIRLENDCESVKHGTFVIEIEDSGQGIATDKHELIFERFYQVNQKDTQSTGGIGLYLTKAFVDLHKGTLTVQSEVGQGSCFRIEIPCKSIENEQYEFVGEPSETLLVEDETSSQFSDTISEKEFGTKRNRFTILLAEDDAEMNEFIANSLSDSFRVIRTYNGREALEYARKENPDLLVTDIMMPEMDGIELCRKLQSDLSTSHIPILILTAKTTTENEKEGLKTGALDYICKPFNVSALRLKISNILAMRSQLHEHFRKNTLLEPEAVTLTSIDDQFLKAAVDAVQANLDKPEFDVERLSHAIGLSSNQTYRKIKALTGQTAKEFIRNQRLKVAAQMLVQRKRNVQEIIYMVGFSSPSYFTKCFKEYFGCTPSEYIEKEAGE